jgi:hypothetical protein
MDVANKREWLSGHAETVGPTRSLSMLLDGPAAR